MPTVRQTNTLYPLGVLIALGAGIFIGANFSWYSASRPNAPADQQNIRPEEGSGRSGPEMAQAKEPRPSVAPPAPAEDASVQQPAYWRSLAQLRDLALTPVAIPVIGSDHKLSPTFATIFDLSPRQVERLQTAIDAAGDKLAALEVRNASVNTGEAGTINITVAPFPAEGGAIYDSLADSFAQVLGPERNSAFQSLAADQIDREFRQFGVEQRNITVSYDASKQQSSPYLLVDRYSVGTQSQGARQTSFRYIDELTKHIGSVGQLVSNAALLAGKR